MTPQTYQMPEYQVEQLRQIIGHQEIGDWPVKVDDGNLPLPSMEWRDIDRAGCTYDYKASVYVIPGHAGGSIPHREKYPRPLRVVTGQVYRHHVQVGDLRIGEI